MQLQLRATLEDLAALQQQAPPQQVLLLDTRNAQQFSGEVRRGPRGGRIPGAVSLPRADLLDPETGGLRPLEEQQQLLQQAGVVLPAADTQPQQRLVVYCNGGVAACTAALALHRLGHRRWAVYDGSWNEYSAAIELPVELPK
jgi:thiosulfate/3-mercaptopyruvate sulfurtransferase